MTTRAINRTYVFDALTRLQDATAVTSTAAGELATVAQVVDLGEGYQEMVMVCDISALTTGGGTPEEYEYILQLGDAVGFGGVVVDKGSLKFGAAHTPGRYTLFTDNQFDETVFQFARVMIIAATGTANSITAEIYLTKLPPM